MMSLATWLFRHRGPGLTECLVQRAVGSEVSSMMTNFDCDAGETARSARWPRRRFGPRLAVAFGAVVVALALSANAVRVTATPLPVLVVYDSAGTWGYLGSAYALMLQNLLGHFSVSIASQPANAY